MEAVLVSLDDLKNGTTVQLANHEQRLEKLETEQRDFRRTWKLVVALIAGGSAILGGVVGTLDHIVDFLTKPK